MPRFPESRNVLDPGCDRCPALVDCRERISWGTGPLDATLAVVGEAPGAGDPDADRWRGGNWTGKAYTTRHSGRRVRALVADLGYAGDCYFTNAVKCFPAADDGSNREPTAAERANCRDHLRTELAQVTPDAVLATGKHATQSLLAADGRALDGFVDSVLDPVGVESLGVDVLPLLHPSYQDVWLGRLGYDREGYVAAIREELAALVG
ncbi:uracil-DNA glycosylase [Halostella litorea]|uniref:uracil-DNA glycosylase n=1 Tax=Halostella litorea TaxID=2528831 RepID=UPI001092CADC|nr:uracil-DNA glycosylase family protein [Halostella litorea]